MRPIMTEEIRPVTLPAAFKSTFSLTYLLAYSHVRMHACLHACVLAHPHISLPARLHARSPAYFLACTLACSLTCTLACSLVYCLSKKDYSTGWFVVSKRANYEFFLWQKFIYWNTIVHPKKFRIKRISNCFLKIPLAFLK